MLSTSQAAEMLNVSTSRMRAMAASGAIPAQKIGRNWAIEEADVMKRMLNSPTPGRPKKQTSRTHEEARKPTDMDAARKLYQKCKETLRRHPDADMLRNAKTPEEADFYIAVSDFFLQQKQKALVEQGVY